MALIHGQDTLPKLFRHVVRARGEESGIRIVVTQLDADGNVTWEIAGPGG